MKHLTFAALFCLMAGSTATAAFAQSVNAGGRDYTPDTPFIAEAVASFAVPWAIAVLPDGRMLVTEREEGALFLVNRDGGKTAIEGVPASLASGQNGMLDVAIAPDFAESGTIYLSYVEPDSEDGALVLARGRLLEDANEAALDDPQVIWRQSPSGGGGQPGGIIAFDPAGQHVFLTVGDRMRPETAQDPTQARGKVLRLNLDGSTPADNPDVADGGVAAQTWTTGHRNPYGLAFDKAGRLWLHEMGPQGGDEFNLLEQGRNYGWPLVSNGDNYDGSVIPDHDTAPEFAAPALYWNPIVAPAGLVFYDGALFPDWNGAALIGGLASTALIRVDVAEDGSANEVARWNMGERIRDVAVSPDGAVWVIENSDESRLLRLTPKGD